MNKMKVHHWIFLVTAIIVALLIVHYFTHHKGQSVIGSYIPGA